MAASCPAPTRWATASGGGLPTPSAALPSATTRTLRLRRSDEGDFITVNNKRYARCVMLEDFSDTPEHKDAMEQREIVTANASALIEIERLKATIAFLEHELDIWKDRYEAADEALEQCIRQWDKEHNEAP